MRCVNAYPLASCSVVFVVFVVIVVDVVAYVIVHAVVDVIVIVVVVVVIVDVVVVVALIVFKQENPSCHRNSSRWCCRGLSASTRVDEDWT